MISYKKISQKNISLWSAAAGAAVLCCCVLFTETALAAGTPAGTAISNQATAHYTIGAGSYSSDSNTNIVKVAELVDNVLVWQDGLPGVSVSPGQTGRVATMKLTNAGNGQDTYRLTMNGALTGDEFDPVPAAIYMDANGNGTFDAGTDPLYTAGTNDPSLAPDGSIVMFLLCDMPAAGVADGSRGNAALTAATTKGPGAPGTVLAGKGTGGTDAVLGLSGGASTATAVYVAASITVNVVKSAAIADPYGGAEPVSGAVIRYTLAVTASGSGTAMNVVISDPIPAHTAYVPGTLRLNNNGLTDGLDADAGDVGGTAAGNIAVKLGNLMSASPAAVITFDVKIN